MKLRVAKKILNYSRKDDLADFPEVINGYKENTKENAYRRYNKWVKRKFKKQ